MDVYAACQIWLTDSSHLNLNVELCDYTVPMIGYILKRIADSAPHYTTIICGAIRK